MLLTWDQAALTPEDWTRVEQWLHYSRLELLSALESMREEDLETAAGEGSRSIAAQLRHLAGAEYMYALWTFDLRSKQDVKDLLDWTRRMAMERMRILAGRHDNRLTSAEWSGNEHPDPWTARKAARRLVYHERWHLSSIRRLLQGLRGRHASGEGW
ncbi:MAG TPA: DinB family protein [bacterium]